VDTGVAGFTKKSGVFFAYGVDGPEFFPALYIYFNDRQDVGYRLEITPYNLDELTNISSETLD